MLREALPEIVTGSVPGPKAAELLKRRDAAIPKAMCGTTYPICMGRGEGAMLEDVDGNRFLDWIGGVGVLNIGYSNPEVVEAVKAQADKYFHGIFNVYVHEGYVKLAEMFDETMPCRGDKMKTYFANSGAEADENAIKIAKAYTGRNNVICFSGAFHGRTNLTMALTAKKAYALGMGPFPAGIYRAEFPYLYRAPKGYTEEEAIDYYIEKFLKLFDEATPASDVAAVILEPLQGEGGFIPAPIEFVKRLRKICDDNGIMLIADEVQCGNCRTGKYFASEYWKEAGAAPDIIATAKSMGAGVPISAITARAEVMDAAPAGTIGGMVINTAGVTLAHGMEHPASGLKNIVHGQGLAALTPVIIEASYKGNREKFSKIARIIGGMTAEDCATKIRTLLRKLDLDCTLSDLGIKEEDIPWMAENCMKVSAAGVMNNPVVFSKEEIAEIYRKAL